MCKNKLESEGNVITDKVNQSVYVYDKEKDIKYIQDEDLLNIYNPYRDPWKLRITKNVPDFDGQAYKQYPKHNFVYDKLWVAKSQGVESGELEDLIENRYKRQNWKNLNQIN